MRIAILGFIRSAATAVNGAVSVGARAGKALLLVMLCGSSALFAQNAETTYSRLGVPEVHSALGSPLWVKIPVDVLDPATEIDASAFSLGTKPVNAGIPFLETAEISFERQGTRYFLVIRSRQRIDELAIGIVIRERLQNGVRSREFNLLLDPYPLFEARTAEIAANAARVEASASAQQAIQPPLVAAPQTAVLAQPPASAAPIVAAAAKGKGTRQPRPKRSSTPGTNARVSSAPTDMVASPADSVGRPRGTLSSKPAARAAPATGMRKVRPAEPGLRLSLSTENLSPRPSANEETRAEIRRRQLILDTDDLTSTLLERNHRITLLETELASLSARVSATERTLNVNRPPPGSGAVDLVATPSTVTAPPATAPSPVVEDPVTEAPKPVVPIVTAPLKVAPSPRPFSIWTTILIGVGLLAIVGAAAWLVRRYLRARDKSFRLETQAADAYVAEVLAQTPKHTASQPGTSNATRKPAATKSPARTTPVAGSSIPEIHFELPELPPSASVVDAPAPGASKGKAQPAKAVVPVAGAASASATDDVRARRMRYLQSRYQDIAILTPPLDAPQRLLNQAGRVHDEGAAEFAKRLLKFAAYSRPHTEEYWLALLEVLYREKFANDYLVNARWFRQFHPQSKHWEEVQRIGYLLDSSEPIFASAAAWSHEEPAIGVWLPSDQTVAKPLMMQQQVKLELAS